MSGREIDRPCTYERGQHPLAVERTSDSIPPRKTRYDVDGLISSLGGLEEPEKLKVLRRSGEDWVLTAKSIGDHAALDDALGELGRRLSVLHTDSNTLFMWGVFINETAKRHFPGQEMPELTKINKSVTEKCDRLIIDKESADAVDLASGEIGRFVREAVLKISELQDITPADLSEANGDRLWHEMERLLRMRTPDDGEPVDFFDPNGPRKTISDKKIDMWREVNAKVSESANKLLGVLVKDGKTLNMDSFIYAVSELEATYTTSGCELITMLFKRFGSDNLLHSMISKFGAHDFINELFDSQGHEFAEPKLEVIERCLISAGATAKAAPFRPNEIMQTCLRIERALRADSTERMIEYVREKGEVHAKILTVLEYIKLLKSIRGGADVPPDKRMELIDLLGTFMLLTKPAGDLTDAIAGELTSNQKESAIRELKINTILDIA